MVERADALQEQLKSHPNSRGGVRRTMLSYIGPMDCGSREQAKQIQRRKLRDHTGVAH
jgi:hypothetical protein